MTQGERWEPRSRVLGKPTQTAGRSSSAASGEWTAEAGDKLYCSLRAAASSANLISAAAKGFPSGGIDCRVMCDPLNDLLGKAGVCNVANRRGRTDQAHAHVRYGL